MMCKHSKSLSDVGWCQIATMYCTFTQESRCKHKTEKATELRESEVSE